MKKAFSVYCQLRMGGIEKQKIIFNGCEDAKIVFNCKLSDKKVLAQWAPNKSDIINYKRVLSYFFVDVGYKGKIDLNPRFKS
ncbi:MAG: hypothetical protein E7311_03065 [Clostridiales bacterium]|nr:hypothetical protein [Clostridiales bacterium]